VFYRILEPQRSRFVIRILNKFLYDGLIFFSANRCQQFKNNTAGLGRQTSALIRPETPPKQKKP
jgi:hypothetical protein